MIVCLGLAIVVAIGHQLWEQAAVNSNSIMESMEKVTIDSRHDWVNWRSNSNVNQSSLYFVAVHNHRPGAARTHYFTPYARYLVHHRIKLTKTLFYSPGIGLLYRQTGGAHGIHYVVWTRMDMQINVLLRIILVTTAVMVIAIIFSIYCTKRLSRRLTRPLLQLVADTKAQSASISEEARISVPQEPVEVQRLAKSFNRLLQERFNNQKEQQRFLMNATHELKTPIAAIYSHVQLIERHGQDHPEIVPKSIHFISDETQQMTQSINQMLTLSRAETTNATLVPTDISQVITDQVNRLQGTIRQKLDLQVSPGLMVKTTADSLAHIIDNLVGNAAKYAGAETTIHVAVRAKDAAHVQLIVADQGPGISDADKPNVFKRFYRSDAVRGSYEGSGLGLAIVDRLVKVCQGKIAITDAQPHGAIFTVTFPRI